MEITLCGLHKCTQMLIHTTKCNIHNKTVFSNSVGVWHGSVCLQEKVCLHNSDSRQIGFAHPHLPQVIHNKCMWYHAVGVW